MIEQPDDPPCHDPDCTHPTHCDRCSGVHHAVPSLARHCESIQKQSGPGSVRAL